MGERTSNGSVWKWIAGVSVSVALFFLGGFVGDGVGSSRVAELETEVRRHVESAGHPVMSERVESLEQRVIERLERIEERLGRIEEKLD